MKLVSLKSDYAFKELFSYENVRKQFISDVLGIPITEIKSARIVNPYLRKWYHKQKQGILDVALELNDDTRMDIEMQVHPQKYWIKRNLFYLAKTYTDDLKIGQDYSKLRKCISISILDFQLIDSVSYHTIYSLRDREGQELTDLFELHIIELRKKLDNADIINDWIRLFNAKTQEDLDMIKTKNVGISEAIEVVKAMSLGKSLRYLYEQHVKAKRDRWAEDAYVRDQALREIIFQWLEELGPIPEDLFKKISKEENTETLISWSKAAANAKTIQDFREHCQI